MDSIFEEEYSSLCAYSFAASIYNSFTRDGLVTAARVNGTVIIR
jgi:hypothetical protein